MAIPAFFLFTFLMGNKRGKGKSLFYTNLTKLRKPLNNFLCFLELSRRKVPAHKVNKKTTIYILKPHFHNKKRD